MSILRPVHALGTRLSQALDAIRTHGASLTDLDTLERSVTAARERSPVAPEIAWRSITHALRTSSNPIDRRQLFLGFEAVTRALVYLPIETLWGHGYLSGASDAGKTSRTLLPLALQLMGCEDLTPKRSPLYRGPILIIDLKGEPYFFHAVRSAARDTGRTFRFFTNHPTDLTYGFNPILNFRELHMVRSEVRDHVRLGMNLEHGAEYGKEHFASLNREEFDALLEEHPEAQSFFDLAAFLPGPNDPGRLKPAEASKREHNVSLRMAVKDLARIPGLNVVPSAGDSPVYEASVRMARAFAEDEVIYFYLRQRPQEAVARIVGALAIECFYAACRAYNQDNRHPDTPQKHGYVIIDEFQNIAGRNFDGFMETARSTGLSLLLASQSPEKLAKLGIAHAIEHSTSFRQFFSARTPDALSYLTRLSGTTEHGVESDSGDGPRFTTNDLLALDAEPGFCIVKMSNRDYSQYGGVPVAAYLPYAMTEAEKDAFEAMPWPPGSGELLRNSDSPIETDGLPSPSPVAGLGAPQSAAAPISNALAPPPEDTALARAFAAIRITPTGYPPSGDDT